MRAALALMLAALILAPTAMRAASPVPWTEMKFCACRDGLDPRTWGWGGLRYYMYNMSAIFTAGLCIASSPVLVDVDGDGSDDIFFASCDGNTYGIHGRDYRVMWGVKAGYGLVSPAAADLDGDGVVDIVVGGPGGLYALNSLTGGVEWVINGSFHRAVPAIADVDGDGELEVVANEMGGYVTVVSASGEVELRQFLGHEAVHAPAVGDVTGDGIDDIVAVEGSFIHILTHGPGGWSLLTADLNATINGFPALHDIDGDGVPDILVVAGETLYAVSFSSWVLWSASVHGEIYTSPSVGDIDGDGEAEVVVPTSDGIFVFSLNGSLKSFYPGVDASFGSVIIADIDGDGSKEMVVARYDGRVEIVDVGTYGSYFSGIEFVGITGGPIMAPPSIGDIDGDGLPEVVVGSRDFRLYIIDGVPEEAVMTPATTSTTTTSITSVSSPSPTSLKTTTTQAVTTSTTSAATLHGFTTGPAPMVWRPNTGLLAALAVLLAAVVALAVLGGKLRWSRV